MKIALSFFGLALMGIGVVCLSTLGYLFVTNVVLIVPQICAVVLMVWARAAFGLRSFHAAANPTNGGIVTSGPYRYIRHPIYTAACLFVLPAAVASWSLVGLALGVLVLVGAFIRMILEERLIVTRYPEYEQYAAVTKRMIPGMF